VKAASSRRHLVLLGIALLLALGGLAGCSAATRHTVLSTLFDGVPAPAPAAVETETSAPGGAPLRSGVGASQEHGPYAARLCTACHVAGSANAVGGMVSSPSRVLCLQCHEMPERRFVHGPVAAGECRACHDPHSSPHRPLLVASSDNLCLSCHERTAMAAHPGGDQSCLRCHDAHASEQRSLLR
jgi:predicted CXXCH cytochrome family protein